MEAKGDGLRGISWSAVTLDVFTSANSELTDSWACRDGAESCSSCWLTFMLPLSPPQKNWTSPLQNNDFVLFLAFSLKCIPLLGEKNPAVSTHIFSLIGRPITCFSSLNNNNLPNGFSNAAVCFAGARWFHLLFQWAPLQPLVWNKQASSSGSVNKAVLLTGATNLLLSAAETCCS